MTPKTIIQEVHHKTNTFSVYLSSLIYGLVVLILDPEFGNVVVTPLMNLSWLLVLAFFRRTHDVIVISSIFWIFVIASLWGETPAVLIVRSISFFLSSMIAVMFSVSQSSHSLSMKLRKP